jgi:hypothetical protein
MKLEQISQWGWSEVLRVENEHYELLIPLEIGPRILSFRRHGGPNLFKIIESQMGTRDEQEWVPRGGHRLWTAPEDLTRTYAPDNSPIQWNTTAETVEFTQEDRQSGLRKTICLSFVNQWVEVVHRITNLAPEPTSFALWALTVLAPGGFACLPLPPKAAHPGPPSNARSAQDYAPNQSLILWPFTNLNDSRIYWGKTAVHLRQDSQANEPTKFGLAHTERWAAYLLGEEAFIKEFGYEQTLKYPDRGCNFETFTNAEMLEMETLSPWYEVVRPGQTLEHRERWRLFPFTGAHFGEENWLEAIQTKVMSD